MIITVQEDGFVPLDHFKNLLDISQVVYYALREKNGIVTLKFYDKNKKLIPLNKETKNGKSKKSKKNKG